MVESHVFNTTLMGDVLEKCERYGFKFHAELMGDLVSLAECLFMGHGQSKIIEYLFKILRDLEARGSTVKKNDS